jgi:transposase-like protein
MSKGAMAAKKRRREEARFLAELRVDGVVHRACKRAGLAVSTLYRWRDESSRFAKGWEAAKAQAAAALHAPAATPADVARPLARANSNWPKPFLRALAETSNVRAAAEQAGVDTLRVYRLRRDNPQFAADWRAALAEGYDHLEMETLAWLRGHGESARKVDVPNAVRLLAAHRKTMAEIRAAQEPDDEQAVLASIDALFDSFRREAAAVDAMAEQASGAKETEAGDGEQG